MLELELRQLPGVSFVAFDHLDGATLVELAAASTTDIDDLRVEALRLAVAHLDGPVVIEVIDDDDGVAVTQAAQRVQLLLALTAPAGSGVEIHLARQERRVAVDAPSGDYLAIAEAVITGLGRLQLPVPFAAVGVHLLAEDLGSGALVILQHRVTGERRRGLAGGRSTAEAISRAVLNGLNRYIQTARWP